MQSRTVNRKLKNWKFDFKLKATVARGKKLHNHQAFYKIIID